MPLEQPNPSSSGLSSLSALSSMMQIASTSSRNLRKIREKCVDRGSDTQHRSRKRRQRIMQKKPKELNVMAFRSLPYTV
eukprot:scaffold296420_cov18-Tisochrysis_lutea.AAC.1